MSHNLKKSNTLDFMVLGFKSIPIILKFGIHTFLRKVLFDNIITKLKFGIIPQEETQLLVVCWSEFVLLNKGAYIFSVPTEKKQLIP